MKTILLTILLIPTICYSQHDALDSCKFNFNIARSITKRVRDSLKTMTDERDVLHKIDSTEAHDIIVAKSDIDSMKLILRDKETFITSLKQLFSPVIPPLVTFDGCYMNFIVGYDFSPESITTPIVKVLKYGISAEFVFKVLDKVKLVIEPVLPFKEKFFVQVKGGWRIF